MEVTSVDLIGVTSQNEYVYDLETEDGTYLAGDGILVKNTDSCYVRFNLNKEDFKTKNGDFDEISYMKENFRLAQECADKITKTFKKPIDLEFEKFMYPFFLFEKKRYAYQEWTEPEKPHKELEFKGVSVVRRDYCPYVKEVCVQLFEILMRGKENKGIVDNQKTIEDAIDYTKKAINDLFGGKVDTKKLIISKSLKNSYKIDSKQIPWDGWEKDANGIKKQFYDINMPHVRLAQKLKKVDPINHPKPPDRVPYIFIVDKNAKLQWERVEHPDYLESKKIDYLYYFDHQLKMSITQIFDLMIENTEDIYKRLRLDKINQMNGQSQISQFFKVDTKTKGIKLKENGDSSIS